MSKKATKRELVRRKRQVARSIFLKKAARKSYDRPDDFKKPEEVATEEAAPVVEESVTPVAETTEEVVAENVESKEE